MALPEHVLELADAGWLCALVLLSAMASCVLQFGYAASALLMAAHAMGRTGGSFWLVSRQSLMIVPPEMVDPTLLYRGGDVGSEDPQPSYVVAWFALNAIIANLFALFAVCFLLTVDVVRLWQVSSRTCADDDEDSCSGPTLQKLRRVQHLVTKAHCIYNIVAQGITVVITQPALCPAPCRPHISYSYLCTLGLVISSLKLFEAVVHKIVITAEAEDVDDDLFDVAPRFPGAPRRKLNRRTRKGLPVSVVVVDGEVRRQQYLSPNEIAALEQGKEQNTPVTRGDWRKTLLVNSHRYEQLPGNTYKGVKMGLDGTSAVPKA